MTIELIETTERLLFKLLLMFSSGNIAKGNENRIAGMVMGFIERFKLLVTEIRNIFWFAAAVVVISTRRIEVLTHGLPED